VGAWWPVRVGKKKMKWALPAICRAGHVAAWGCKRGDCHRCAYCGSGLPDTVAHITPLSRGGEPQELA